MKSPFRLPTAVLPDLPEEAFGCLLDAYLLSGYSDFKIQLSGLLKPDRLKLFQLAVRARQHGVARYRICLDARKLWDGDVDVDRLIAHVRALVMPSAIVEVPVSHDDVEALGRISRALGSQVVVPLRSLPGASSRRVHAVA